MSWVWIHQGRLFAPHKCVTTPVRKTDETTTNVEVYHGEEGPAGYGKALCAGGA